MRLPAKASGVRPALHPFRPRRGANPRATITLPSGLGAHGLQLGLQVVGGYLQDARLLQVAQWCQVQLGFRHSPPELSQGTI